MSLCLRLLLVCLPRITTDLHGIRLQFYSVFQSYNICYVHIQGLGAAEACSIRVVDDLKYIVKNVVHLFVNINRFDAS